MEFAVLPSRNSLMQMYRLLYICTDHTTSKETGIMLLEKTLVITLSAVVFLRTAVLGWDFLVLLFFFLLHLFWKQKAGILTADTASGTCRVNFIPNCQAPVQSLIQPFIFKPSVWESDQCANSSIIFTSVAEGFLYCFGPAERCVRPAHYRVLALEECSRESTELSVLYLP